MHKICGKKKKIITRAKLVAKQRVGFPLMSKATLEVRLRSRVLNLVTKKPKYKKIKKNRMILGTT